MIKTLTLSTCAFILVATAATADDGHESQKKVYEGLLPSRTTILEGRTALQPLPERGYSPREISDFGGQANIRIQDEATSRSRAGYGN